MLLDVTEALRQLKVMVFKADIIIDNRGVGGEIRHQAVAGRERRARGASILLTDERGQPISSVSDRKVICNRVLGCCAVTPRRSGAGRLGSRVEDKYWKYDMLYFTT